MSDNATSIPPFHLAFPVRDLTETRAFYGELLGCPEGRSSEEWIDFNFFGHQIVAHLSPDECRETATSGVDNHQVPVRHFGAVLSIPAWELLADKLKAASVKSSSNPTSVSKANRASRPPCSLPIPQATPSSSRDFET